MIFLLQFIFSVLIEFVIFGLALYLIIDILDFRFFKKLLFIVIGLNLFTQVLFNFILSLLFSKFIPYLVISEFFIIVIEALLLYQVIKRKYNYVSYWNLLLISLMANLISWQFTPFMLEMVF